MTENTKYRDLVTSYAEDMRLLRTGVQKGSFIVLLVALVVAPFLVLYLGDRYALYLLNLSCIAVVVALGLDLLIGTTGLISLGHAGFVAVGAYAAGILSTRLDLPFFLIPPAAGLVSGGIGLVVGLPALRLKGLYLALATLAFQFIAEHVILHWESATGGALGMAVPRSDLLATDLSFYFLILPLLLLLGWGLVNLRRSRFGRALVALRDSDVAAAAVGVNLAFYKTLAFGLSAAYAGVAGGLLALYLGYIGPDHFTVMLSIEYVAMIIIGGMNSLLGAVLGALFITVMPEGIRLLEGALRGSYPGLVFPDLRSLVMGLALILFIAFEPEGLAGRWRRIKEYWTTWPF